MAKKSYLLCGTTTYPPNPVIKHPSLGLSFFYEHQFNFNKKKVAAPTLALSKTSFSFFCGRTSTTREDQTLVPGEK
jgi:hypothetical protein